MKQLKKKIENFICDTCGHKSTSGRKLKIHINLHSKDPVSCEDCQKVFNKFTQRKRAQPEPEVLFL